MTNTPAQQSVDFTLTVTQEKAAKWTSIINGPQLHPGFAETDGVIDSFESGDFQIANTTYKLSIDLVNGDGDEDGPAIFPYLWADGILTDATCDSARLDGRYEMYDSIEKRTVVILVAIKTR